VRGGSVGETEEEERTKYQAWMGDRKETAFVCAGSHDSFDSFASYVSKKWWSEVVLFGSFT
jgi:hypothetical protein